MENSYLSSDPPSASVVNDAQANTEFMTYTTVRYSEVLVSCLIRADIVTFKIKPEVITTLFEREMTAINNVTFYHKSIRVIKDIMQQ